jgi:hypothetical protein
VRTAATDRAAGDSAAQRVKLLVAVLALTLAVASWSQAPGPLTLARVGLAAWGVAVAARERWQDSAT